MNHCSCHFLLISLHINVIIIIQCTIYVTEFNLWKPFTCAHNDKAQISLLIDGFINKLTSHYWHTTKKQVCFCWNCFLSHVRCTIVLGWPWSGCGSPYQAGAGPWIGCCLLYIDLATFDDISGTTGLHLSPFGGLTSSCVFFPPLLWLPTTPN